MSGDGLNPAEWESYPGESERLEELDRLQDLPSDNELDMSQFEGADGSTIPGPSPGAPREQTLDISGAIDGAMTQDGSIRLTFTDTGAVVDADGLPLTQVTATIATSSGHTQPVTLYIGTEGRADGVAQWASQPISAAGGKHAVAFPIAEGDTITATLGAYTATVDTVVETNLDLQLHLLHNDLEQSLQFLKDLLTGYAAGTEGFHDDPDVAYNIERIQEGIHTAEQGLLHFDDPGLPASRVGRAEYYLEHLPLQRHNLQYLADGKRLMSPFSEDIRQITTLKRQESMISFYQHDVTIREHSSSIVTDAQKYGEFVKGNALGRSFDDISEGILFGTYDMIVDKSEMAWVYPLLALVITGEATDHLGKKLTAGETAGVIVQAGLAAGGKLLDGLEKSGRITRDTRGLNATDIDFDAEFGEYFAGKASGAIEAQGIAALGAVLDDEQALAGNKPKNPTRGADVDPSAPVTSRFGGRLKKAGAALAVGVIAGGGALVLTNGDDAPADMAPPGDVASDGPTAAEELGLPPLPGPPVDEDATPLPPAPTDGGGGISDELQAEIDGIAEGLDDLPAPVGPSVADLMDQLPPYETSEDEWLRSGGGSLQIEYTYVVDWKAPIVVDNGIIYPGGTFEVPSTFSRELIIFADCDGENCSYTTELAAGEIVEFEVDGLSLMGSTPVITEFCDRTIFIMLNVSDLQTIGNRLVPDALIGGQIETGTCETEVYREITYNGGYDYVGSFADQ